MTLVAIVLDCNPKVRNENKIEMSTCDARTAIQVLAHARVPRRGRSVYSGTRPAWLPSLDCLASGIFAANLMTQADSRRRAASCCTWSDCPEQITVGHNNFQQDVVTSAPHLASAECIKEGVSGNSFPRCVPLSGSGTRNCSATYNTFCPLLTIRTLQKLQTLPCVAL